MNSDGPRDSVGGGGSSAEFLFSVTSTGHFPLMGPFFSFLLSRRGGGARAQNFSFP